MGQELGDRSQSQGVAREISRWPRVSAAWCRDAGAASRPQRLVSRSLSALAVSGEGTRHVSFLPLSTDVAVGPERVICQRRRLLLPHACPAVVTQLTSGEGSETRTTRTGSA